MLHLSELWGSESLVIGHTVFSCFREEVVVTQETIDKDLSLFRQASGDGEKNDGLLGC